MRERRNVVDDMERDMAPDAEETKRAPVVGNWAAIGGGAAMLVCCLGHGLLLTLGAAGFAAVAGTALGSPAVVISAVVLFAATGALLAVRLRRRWRALSARNRS